MSALYFLFRMSPFLFICSDTDIGDKYSVFRQLEQPSDKKPVGKEASQKHSNIGQTYTHTYTHLLVIPVDGTENILDFEMVPSI